MEPERKLEERSAGNQVAGLSPAFSRPYVVSWNLTYRCNLACEHCYLDAGGKPAVHTREFADRSELSTEECFQVIDNIVAFAPECLTILTGGEPLLRKDILEIVAYGRSKKLWIVVGTNGVRITANLVRLLTKEGVRGFSLSLDALEPQDHDRFRRVRGAWQNTVRGAKILQEQEVPFIIQTTVAQHNADQLEDIARFAYEELGARVWNLYFLVPTGRGQFTSDLSPAAYDRVLSTLQVIQAKFRSKMLVNAKCAPHYVKTLFETDPESPFLKTYTGGAGGCPAGTQYLGIRPNGDVTPCPYLPVYGGNLKERALVDIWNHSEPFLKIRERSRLQGRCGACEFKPYCGGCRARAYGMTGDLMHEDPLCTFEPGRHVDVVNRIKPELVYGQEADSSVEWDEPARSRMQKIPAFVRGMVVKKVEAYCRERGINRVTESQLREIRSRMPTSKIFGKKRLKSTDT